MAMRGYLTGALLAAAVSLPAVAQEALTPRSPENNQSTRRICRISGKIGTRLWDVRTCRTKAEWEQSARESSQIVDRMQRVAPPCNPWARC